MLDRLLWICGGYIPLTLISSGEFLLRQFQERFPYESAAWIEHRRGEGRVGVLLGDLLEGGFDAGRVGEISADSHGLAAAGVDLLHERIEVGWVTGEQDDGICFGEAPGNAGALLLLVLLLSGDGERTVPGPTPAMIANALDAILVLYRCRELVMRRDACWMFIDGEIRNQR